MPASFRVTKLYLTGPYFRPLHSIGVGDIAHDIRRTVATRMADIGIEPHVIEAALNHFSGHRRGVAGVYNRSTYEPQIKTALARWSEHVIALVEGRASNIVPMRA